MAAPHRNLPEAQFQHLGQSCRLAAYLFVTDLGREADVQNCLQKPGRFSSRQVQAGIQKMNEKVHVPASQAIACARRIPPPALTKLADRATLLPICWKSPKAQRVTGLLRDVSGSLARNVANSALHQLKEFP